MLLYRSAYAIFRNENNIYIVIRVLITCQLTNEIDTAAAATARSVEGLKNTNPLYYHEEYFKVIQKHPRKYSEKSSAVRLHSQKEVRACSQILYNVCLEFFCVNVSILLLQYLCYQLLLFFFFQLKFSCSFFFSLDAILLLVACFLLMFIGKSGVRAIENFLIILIGGKMIKVVY